MNVLAVNPGFIADNVLTAAVAPPEAKYPTTERLVSFYSTLEDGLTARLGPRAVGIIDELPLRGDRGRGVVSLRPSASGPEAVIRVASTAYFDVLRIPLVAGRAFDRRDDASAPPRVIVSQSLAERLLPGDTAVGRAVWLAGRDEPAEIVGVVGDVKLRALDDPFLPTLYLSLWQAPSRGSLIAIRDARSDADVIAILRDETARLDGELPVYGLGSMPAAIAGSPGVPARRVLTTAFSGFALLAVVLAAIGLFGVVAHDVSARRAELALRIALGADSTHLLNATVGQGALMVGSGLAVGGVLSIWATRALGAMVFSTTYVDVVNVGLPVAILAVTGLVAVLPAALRAARTDPLIALRSE
jgi:hypothetical protein